MIRVTEVLSVLAVVAVAMVAAISFRIIALDIMVKIRKLVGSNLVI